MKLWLFASLYFSSGRRISIWLFVLTSTLVFQLGSGSGLDVIKYPTCSNTCSLDEMQISNMAKTVANALRLTRIDDIKSMAIDVVNTCIGRNNFAALQTSTVQIRILRNPETLRTSTEYVKVKSIMPQNAASQTAQGYSHLTLIKK